MSLLAAIRKLWHSIAPRTHSDVEEEFRSTLDAYQDDLIRQGLPEEEARRKARIDLGQPAAQYETYRDAIGLRLFDELGGDIRYGLRALRRNPGFAAVAVLTLALGIGVTTAILSIIDPVLFRPLPYANSDRLVSVGFRHAVEPFEFMFGNFYYDWSDHQTVFTEMTAQSAVPRPCDLTDRDPMRLTCSYVHQNFLPTLGIRPVVGSNFTTDDMLPDAPLTVMLSYELWKSRYNEQSSLRILKCHLRNRLICCFPSRSMSLLCAPAQCQKTCEFSLASSPELQQLKPMPLCSHYLSKASDPLPLKCAAISTSWCALCAIVKCTTCSP